MSNADLAPSLLLAISLQRLTFNAWRYKLGPLIRSFKSRETERIFNRQRSDRLPQDIQQVALRKLRMLNRAVTVQDLRFLQPTAWKNSPVIVRDSIASASTLNGVFALNGGKGMRMTWKLSIITKDRR